MDVFSFYFFYTFSLSCHFSSVPCICVRFFFLFFLLHYYSSWNFQRPEWRGQNVQYNPMYPLLLIQPSSLYITKLVSLFFFFSFPFVPVSGAFLSLSLPLFLSFSPSSLSSCLTSPDVILVYDGIDSTAPIIGQYCNTKAFVELVSTRRNLFVEFYSRSHFPGQVSGDFSFPQENVLVFGACVCVWWESQSLGKSHKNTPVSWVICLLDWSPVCSM